MGAMTGAGLRAACIVVPPALPGRTARASNGGAALAYNRRVIPLLPENP